LLFALVKTVKIKYNLMKKIILYSSLIITSLTAGNFAQAQDKKISPQGRGAIIGGAGGAVAGGIIGKGVGGALIGGAIGAGGGYIIGNEHRKNVIKKKRAAYRQAYYNKHHRYPRTYPSFN